MGGIAMAPEKHLALFYQDREHQRRMMMPFFSECLKQDLKVLYITNDETTRWIDGLFSKLTVSLDKHPKDQQIKAWTAESVYLREGTLNFDSIIRILQREEKRAESEGFEGLFFQNFYERLERLSRRQSPDSVSISILDHRGGIVNADFNRPSLHRRGRRVHQEPILYRSGKEPCASFLHLSDAKSRILGNDRRESRKDPRDHPRARSL